MTNEEFVVEEMRATEKAEMEMNKAMMTPPYDSLTTAGCMGVSGSADGHEPTLHATMRACICVHGGGLVCGGVNGRR